jgi:hypothetical protein
MNAAFAVRFVFPAVFFFVPADFLAVFELLAMSSPRSGPHACDADVHALSPEAEAGSR